MLSIIPSLGEKSSLDFLVLFIWCHEVEDEADDNCEQWEHQLVKKNAWQRNVSFLWCHWIGANIKETRKYIDTRPNCGGKRHEEASDKHAGNNLLYVLWIVKVHTLSLIDFHPGFVACSHCESAITHVGPARVFENFSRECCLMLSSELLFQPIFVECFTFVFLSGWNTNLEIKEALKYDHEQHDLVHLTDHNDLPVFFNLLEVV